MQELQLVRVHDDGEHLVLRNTSDERFLLSLDDQLRSAIRHARRIAPHSTSKTPADFGPRDIQARFRAGATVEDIAEESGWEVNRLKRYEWPILAERAHMARQAQKVQVVASTPRQGGYRSVFDGEPQTLLQTVISHATTLGISTPSLDWDAWQRSDQQWQVCVRFRVHQPGSAPQDLVDQQPAALWIFNPTTLTVTADNEWARRLTTSPDDKQALSGSDSLFGEPRSHKSAESVQPVAPSTTTVEPPEDPAQNTDELLDVLNARRGQRIGQDTDSDDQLAEILGRNMGHVNRRPRPLSAPQDSTLFDHPAGASRPMEPASTGESPTHALGRADEHAGHPTAAVEITDDDSRPLTVEPDSVPEATVTALRSNSSQETTEDSGQRARPRGRVGAKRSRSSVPSWDDIVFGSKTEEPR